MCLKIRAYYLFTFAALLIMTIIIRIDYCSPFFSMHWALALSLVIYYSAVDG